MTAEPPLLNATASTVESRLAKSRYMNMPDLALQALVDGKPLVTGDEQILVLGAGGQVGKFLVPELQKYYPEKNLILADSIPKEGMTIIDVTDKARLQEFIHPGSNVKVVINLAAFLSKKSEDFPTKAHEVNVLAPAYILDIAQQSGVRKVFTPSSVAALGTDARKLSNDLLAAEPYEKGDGKGLKNPGGFGVPHYDDASTIGVYGNAKKALEDNSAKANQSQSGLLAMCLRYGGVLTCQKDPSDGTTEEIDKMIVAAAKFKAYSEIKKQSTKYRIPFISKIKAPKAEHAPAISKDCTFPLLDGQTVATETLRFLHSDPKREEAHHYHMAEFSASIGEVAQLVQSLAPGFKVNFDGPHDASKEAFAKAWPTHMDCSASVTDWDFRQHCTLKQSVLTHFGRLVKEFKKDFAKDNKELRELQSRESGKGFLLE